MRPHKLSVSDCHCTPAIPTISYGMPLHVGCHMAQITILAKYNIALPCRLGDPKKLHWEQIHSGTSQVTGKIVAVE